MRVVAVNDGVVRMPIDRIGECGSATKGCKRCRRQAQVFTPRVVRRSAKAARGPQRYFCLKRVVIAVSHVREIRDAGSRQEKSRNGTTKLRVRQDEILGKPIYPQHSASNSGRNIRQVCIGGWSFEVVQRAQRIRERCKVAVGQIGVECRARTHLKGSGLPYATDGGSYRAVSRARIATESAILTPLNILSSRSDSPPPRTLASSVAKPLYRKLARFRSMLVYVFLANVPMYRKSKVTFSRTRRVMESVRF